jgi:hypothetical protein
MGKGSKGVEAHCGSRFVSCEAYHVCVSPEEDRGGSEIAVGASEGGEESSLAWGTKKARWIVGGLSSSHRLRWIAHGNESYRLVSEVTLRAEGHRNIPRFPVRLYRGKRGLYLNHDRTTAAALEAWIRWKEVA